MDDEQRHHLESLQHTHLRRLRILQQQRAKLGVNSPPSLQIQIEDLQAELAQIAVELGGSTHSPTIPRLTHQLARHDFFAHILLPVNYVIRTDLLAEVCEALLSATPAVALTSKIANRSHRTTALHGMGGIGKSVIARALCEDSAVQATFSDGILWATLGQTPDLSRHLRQWIAVLEGIVSEDAPTVESLKANLAGLLHERACLLIVDDVWEHTHAELFRFDAPRCCLLLTTRDTEIARAIGAKIQPIPLMTYDEAIDLLEEWADGRLEGVDPALKKRIVKRLGRLPLAVKLAGAQLQRRNPDEWLRTFDIRKLKSNRPEGDVHDSLEITFGLSLDTLKTSARRLYIALAIFKEDEAIRISGIRHLWQGLEAVENNEISDLLDDLAARALLEYFGSTSPANIVHRETRSSVALAPAVVLHDRRSR